MFRHLAHSFAGVVGLLALLPGCVSPGPVDSSDLGRSQQVLAERGPQQRLAEEGLGALKPQPTPALPGLDVVHDEQTGRKTINLSLDQAVMRALVNNLDIRVVSYDPAISRQQIIEAAAEFARTTHKTNMALYYGELLELAPPAHKPRQLEAETTDRPDVPDLDAYDDDDEGGHVPGAGAMEDDEIPF